MSSSHFPIIPDDDFESLDFQTLLTPPGEGGAPNSTLGNGQEPYGPDYEQLDPAKTVFHPQAHLGEDPHWPAFGGFGGIDPSFPNGFALPGAQGNAMNPFMNQNTFNNEPNIDPRLQQQGRQHFTLPQNPPVSNVHDSQGCTGPYYLDVFNAQMGPSQKFQSSQYPDPRNYAVTPFQNNNPMSRTSTPQGGYSYPHYSNMYPFQDLHQPVPSRPISRYVLQNQQYQRNPQHQNFGPRAPGLQHFPQPPQNFVPGALALPALPALPRPQLTNPAPQGSNTRPPHKPKATHRRSVKGLVDTTGWLSRTGTKVANKGRSKGTRSCDETPEAVYGVPESRNDSWGPTDEGQPIFSYTSLGQLEASCKLTASNILEYITNCPRPLHIWVQQTPAQSAERLDACDKKCRWAGCPNKNGTISMGWMRVAFDEFGRETTTGHRDPFKVAFSMHLWCLEQITDVASLFEQGLLYADTRDFPLEHRNPMALNRDSDKEIFKNAFLPWFKAQKNKTAHSSWVPRKHEDSLSCALVEHHLDNQPSARQSTRAARNLNRPEDQRRSLDVHKGDLGLYASVQRKFFNSRRAASETSRHTSEAAETPVIEISSAFLTPSTADIQDPTEDQSNIDGPGENVIESGPPAQEPPVPPVDVTDNFLDVLDPVLLAQSVMTEELNDLFGVGTDDLFGDGLLGGDTHYAVPNEPSTAPAVDSSMIFDPSLFTHWDGGDDPFSIDTEWNTLITNQDNVSVTGFENGTVTGDNVIVASNDPPTEAPRKRSRDDESDDDGAEPANKRSKPTNGADFLHLPRPDNQSN